MKTNVSKRKLITGKTESAICEMFTNLDIPKGEESVIRSQVNRDLWIRSKFDANLKHAYVLHEYTVNLTRLYIYNYISTRGHFDMLEAWKQIQLVNNS